MKYVPVSPSEFERYRLYEGDLLSVRTNGNPDYVGRSALFEPELIEENGYAPGQFIYASYLIRARLRQEMVNPYYLQQFLRTNFGRRAIRSRCRTSAGQYNINTGGLGAVPILLPPLPLQNAFAAQAADVRAVAKLQGTSRKQIDLFFSVLLHQAFSGELTAKWREANKDN